MSGIFENPPFQPTLQHCGESQVRLASILELTEVMSGPSELGLRTRIPIPDEFLARQSYIGKVKFSGDGHLNFNVHHAGRR